MNVEPAEDIDPALFTNVSNYVREEYSVRLPRDQLYGDEAGYYEDEDDEWEEEERL